MTVLETLGSDKLTEWKSNRVKFALTSGIAQLALLLAHHCFDLVLNIISIREKRHVCRRWHCCLFYMSSALHGLLKTMSYSVIEEHQLFIVKGPIVLGGLRQDWCIFSVFIYTGKTSKTLIKSI